MVYDQGCYFMVVLFGLKLFSLGRIKVFLVDSELSSLVRSWLAVVLFGSQLLSTGYYTIS